MLRRRTSAGGRSITDFESDAKRGLTGQDFSATIRGMRAIRTYVGTAAVCLAAFLFVTGPGRVASGDERNACGCYRTDGGNCYCDKKAKCGCPGECEPKGCEEKRQKEIDKEINAETKRAQESTRKHVGNDQSAAAAAKDVTSEKRPSSAKPLTPAQLRELAKLLELYVSAHPDEREKGIEQVARELAHAPN